MPQLLVRGSPVSYAERGDGDVLLCVHGWIGSGALWERMLPGLSERFRVIAPDLPGHGDSGMPAGFSFTYPGFSRFLDGLLDALALPSVHLVGHSMGGSISLHYAGLYPHRVRKLVLIDTPSRSAALTWPAHLPFLEWGLGLVHPYWGPHIVAPMIKSSVRHPERLPRPWLQRAVGQGSKLRRRALLETTHLVRDFDLLPVLKRIEAPALVIHGDSDGSVKLSEALRLRDTLPDARLFVVPDCGHCPNYEYPELVSGLVTDFLS